MKFRIAKIHTSTPSLESFRFASVRDSEYSVKSVLQSAKRFVTSNFIMFVDIRSSTTNNKYYFGTVTSRRVGGAITRNYAKRLVREIARKHAKFQKLVDKTIYVILILRKEIAVSDITTLYHDYFRTFDVLVRRCIKDTMCNDCIKK
ncbi:ribonuclease P protein component [Candidatus Fokinia crypta]|uniref:Ribonuclease P protein component n=1 Tax=Candidatus Fokinia crypta TaxID=1920990 RepID=A0ABZ0UVN4_9RICK|nr:ribonuclease P protein component [Candidatus Fokinia cryptica]WPX98150.1 Ribonuclease P protein component [Candidatus Fokinia cryptica]